MPEYLFYTTEGFTLDPKGNDIANCQLLGKAHGENQHIALNKLIADNPWIREHGFNTDSFHCERITSPSPALLER